jgi:hypothetical protein
MNVFVRHQCLPVLARSAVVSPASARKACSAATTCAPSPTAAATRLTEPERGFARHESQVRNGLSAGGNWIRAIRPAEDPRCRGGCRRSFAPSFPLAGIKQSRHEPSSKVGSVARY